MKGARKVAGTESFHELPVGKGKESCMLSLNIVQIHYLCKYK